LSQNLRFTQMLPVFGWIASMGIGSRSNMSPGISTVVSKFVSSPRTSTNELTATFGIVWQAGVVRLPQTYTSAPTFQKKHGIFLPALPNNRTANKVSI
jgi:hypothetical protein